MNQREIIEEYDIPKLTQDDEFKLRARELRNLVLNKDRAYRRLVRGINSSNGRTATKPKGASITGLEEIGTLS